VGGNHRVVPFEVLGLEQFFSEFSKNRGFDEAAEPDPTGRGAPVTVCTRKGHSWPGNGPAIALIFLRSGHGPPLLNRR
jgi:hypothetical protein